MQSDIEDILSILSYLNRPTTLITVDIIFLIFDTILIE